MPGIVLPLTPQSSLGSPVRIEKAIPSSPTSLSSSQSARVQEDDASSEIDPVAGAFQIRRKLQEMMSAAELDDLMSKVPRFVVVGNESSGKSSVLRALTNVPLHIGSRTATRGPTRIQSTRTPLEPFSASIEIVVKDSSGVKRLPFTVMPLTSPAALPEQMLWAGDEARRYDQSGVIRNNVAVAALGSSARSQSLEGCQDYTNNEVVLNISGPLQDNLDIVDLPGMPDTRRTRGIPPIQKASRQRLIGSGLAGTSSSATIAALITEHIAKPQNIIIVCMAVGGDNPTSTGENIRLPMVHDPTGSRTMTCLSKVDFISRPEDSAWGDLITGAANPFGKFRPALGVWPLRLANDEEQEDGLSDQAMTEVEKILFNKPGWKKIVEKASVKSLGRAATKAVILDIHSKRIQEWVEGIPQILDHHAMTQKADEALLVAIPSDPIDVLHSDIIRGISKKVEAAVKMAGMTHGSLTALQHELCSQLLGTIPVFKNYEKADDVPPTSPSSTSGTPDQRASSRRIYLEEVSTLMDKTANPRTGIHHEPAILYHFVKECEGAWRKIAVSHVHTVWAVLQKLLDTTIDQICGGRKRLASTARTSMATLRDEAESGTLAMVRRICDMEIKDPADVAVRSINLNLAIDKVVQRSLRAARGTYFPSEATGAINTPTDVSDSTTTGSPASTPARLKGSLSALRLPAVVEYATVCDVYLFHAVDRLAENVGRMTQLDILDFLDKIEPRLRDAFSLGQLDAATTKRTRDLFESRADTVKRNALAKRQKTLQEAREILAKYSDHCV